MEIEKSNLYSRYKQDADACKHGYYGYELWLEKKLIKAESELKKMRIGDVSSRRELLIAFMESLTIEDLTQIEIAEFENIADKFIGN